jgi:anti-sigma regulatory factor (Ser/Thr protein kinase)
MSPPHATQEARSDFPARMASLPAMTAFIEAWCSRLGIPSADALRLTLIVEELFTNTVKHGHGGDSDAIVTLLVALREDHVSLLYEDRAPPHDPMARLRTLGRDADVTLGDRRIGGLGLLLVASLSEEARYAREDDRNRLWLTLLRSPA